MSVITIRSFLEDRWQDGGGGTTHLHDPTDGSVLAGIPAVAPDPASALEHARRTGGPALRSLGFSERARRLAAISEAIHGHREELIELAVRNAGDTRSDAKFDIDGATATLSSYARLGATLGDGNVLPDGDLVSIGRSPRFAGRHVRVPLEGVAVQINAFNFPAWGFAEKAACAWLAGMPVFVKPATATALVAFRVAEVVAASGALPPGAFSFFAGPAGSLLDHLEGQDVLAFTGSSETAARIRAHAGLIRRSVRVNIEADSLNAAVLGPDAEDASDTFALFVKDAAREMTQKAGQKCTATRRLIVPRDRIAAVTEALAARLADVVIGDPRDAAVRMGPLATAGQRRDVEEGIRQLSGVADAVPGLPRAPEGTGAFVGPALFVARDARDAARQEREIFGPVAMILPYDGSPGEAVELVRLGGGSLVAGVYSDDRDFTRAAVLGILPFAGRVLIGCGKTADISTPPGMVLPDLIHGGPGRAGGGEELGGPRGLALYMRRAALQGPGPLIEKLFG